MVNFKDQSRFVEGTETVTFRVVDSADSVSVEFALFGPITKQQLQFLSTVGVENASQSIKLDEAQLGGKVPIQGSRIDRLDGTKWRVEYIQFSHVTAVHLCYCSAVR